MRGLEIPKDVRSWINIGLVILLLLLPVIVRGDPFTIHVMICALLMGTLAVAWNIIGGYCGQVSFGHAAFFGTGAYVSALLALNGWSPAISILVGAIIGGLALSAIGIPFFRLRGPYFALAMLAFGDIMRYLIIYLKDWTRGALGLYGVPSLPSFTIFGVTVDFYYERVPNYYVFLALMLVTIIVAHKLETSKYGLAFKAIRDDEDAAATRGINTFKCKMLALMVSAFFTALAGALYVHYVHYLNPDLAYDHKWSVFPIVAALFGGIGSMAGSCLGGITIYLIDTFIFRRVLLRGHKVFMGLLLMLVIIFMPNGIMHEIERRLGGGEKKR